MSLAFPILTFKLKLKLNKESPEMEKHLEHFSANTSKISFTSPSQLMVQEAASSL